MTRAQMVLDTEQQEQAPLRGTAPLRSYFFAVRRQSGFDGCDAIILAVYAAILAFAIHHYLPFADEAQEWLIARDSSLHEMLFRRLHYEGHPALWALILWVAARLHMPYAGINWMSGAFAMPGIYMLLRYSPFPRVFRWLLPFTFFFQYQYAVVSRPYVFVPALLFGICIIFTARRPRPVLFGLLAGLLTNISVHAGAAASIFSLLYVLELRRRNRSGAAEISWGAIGRGAGLFLALGICAAAAAFPAPDAVVASKPSKTAFRANPLVRRLISEERLPLAAPPLDEAYDPGKVDPHAEARANAYSLVVRETVITAIVGASAACYPISTSNALAVLFLAAFWLWLWARGTPRLILPFLATIALSAHIFFYDHHTGIFLLCLIAAAWISLRTPGGAALARTRLNWIQPVFYLLALIVALLQIGWTWHCLHSEANAASDPGHETEQFLAQKFSGKRVAAFGFESVSAQPYASQNLFINWPHAYWVWSANTLVDRRRTEALEQHPDAVVVDDVTNQPGVVWDQWMEIVPVGSHPYAQMLDYWQQHGYRETHRFCGQQFRRMSVSYTFCEVIMEPATTANPAPAHANAAETAAR